jgi:hypothetical protein
MGLTQAKTPKVGNRYCWPNWQFGLAVSLSSADPNIPIFPLLAMGEMGYQKELNSYPLD